MKFKISSDILSEQLSITSKVVSAKSSLPILENLLLEIKDKELTIVATDLELTIVTKLPVDECDGDVSFTVESKTLTDILRELPLQPIDFDVNLDENKLSITTHNGKYSLSCLEGDEYPKSPELQDENNSISLSSKLIDEGIQNTLYAVGNDELRQVMNGILFSFKENNLYFVSSDAHKLVRYTKENVSSDFEASFILNKKGANLLKGLLSTHKELDIKVEFDEKNVFFTFDSYKLICRLIDGKYPDYEAVIPKENPNKLTLDRQELLLAVKRVSLVSNKASNLIKLDISKENMLVTGQDIDYSREGEEKIEKSYEYDGEAIKIGFKSTYLVEILSNIKSEEIILELSDPARAGVFLPLSQKESEHLLVLLMPMMLGD